MEALDGHLGLPNFIPMPIPDNDQQKIISLDSGRHLVLAPPGCGKTFILAERVIYAHAHGVEYNDMICLTFTNRASRGMRDRISEVTNNPVPSDLFVGNVHRFCSNYLFENRKIAQNSAVIDDLDAESIITYLGKLDPQEDHSRFATDIVNLQHALSQRSSGMPEQLIVHNDLLSQAELPNMQRRSELAKLYAEYKETDNLLDFEDLLEKAYFHALADPNRKRYKWIQVDEVQDLSFLQFAIIDLFATDDATIVYLGDEQQAIFSFVGAKLAALEQIKNQCRPNIHHLGKNHRSPKYLLDVYNTYAAQQLGIDPELLPTTDDNQQAQPQDKCIFRSCYHDLSAIYNKENLVCQTDGSACTLCPRSIANEYRTAVSLAKRYAEMEPDGRVAIIVSTNADAERISREFGDTPHFKISGRDLFSTPTLQLLFSHFNVIANETCFIAWARLIYHLHVVPEYAAARNLMRELRSRAISPTDLIIYDNSTYLQQFASVIDNEEIVLFDTETTGLDIFQDDIIQIAAIKVRNGKLISGSEFNIIIETDKEIPPIVGGHDNPMLSVYLESDRYSRAEGLKKFLDYCDGHVLIGHNVEYDFNILDYNVRRTLGFELGHRQRFDTLKVIRLVEPRLRVYKLEKLLETLHLEGSNSHNAIDDVMATLSLLTYCRQKADIYIPQQKEIMAMPNMRSIAMRLCEAYRDMFLHTQNRLYKQPTSNATRPAFVDEMQYIYINLVAKGVAKPVEKWKHVADFLSIDIIDPTMAPTLRQQLDRFLVEINTLRESDLCDSTSMIQQSKERYFIATAHKAKGLEFESVIIFNAVEGSYPFYNNIKDNNLERIREDARRFYVAISRAKKHLCITYSAINSRNYPSLPTPFLKCIARHFTHYAYNPQNGRLEAISSTQP